MLAAGLPFRPEFVLRARKLVDAPERMRPSTLPLKRYAYP